MDIFRFCEATQAAALCVSARKRRAAPVFLAPPGRRPGAGRRGCRIAIKTPKGLAAPWNVSCVARVRCASASRHT
ncbi:hypothetical protein CA830_01135 [Burkholderia multivorans]|nr:hypothetical protein CA831_00620 [Burkholderia multivorans]OXH94526.1 hypothetical protein CA830_01135 [Burkholderia multivorans]